MDINMVLSNTINRLSEPKVAPLHPVAEINLHDNSEPSGESRIENMSNVIDTLNKAAGSIDSRVSFQYNDKTKRIVMRIMDPETNELVRQVPTKEMIRLLERINEVTGVFLDEKR
ncbi:MAG TPA: flagellar protein FlaG [Spirochaetota bacterium]|nr:flagellar protein FlaG [Spirochaetota bacterium]